MNICILWVIATMLMSITHLDYHKYHNIRNFLLLLNIYYNIIIKNTINSFNFILSTNIMYSILSDYLFM